jgi:hypothetical protein
MIPIESTEAKQNAKMVHLAGPTSMSSSFTSVNREPILLPLGRLGDSINMLQNGHP